MKKVLLVGLIGTAFFCTPLYSQSGYLQETLAGEFDAQYRIMLEHFFYSRYLEAYDLCLELIEKAPDAAWQQKLLSMKFIIRDRMEDVPPLLPDGKKKKEYDEGLIYFWIKNLIYLTGASQTIPIILDIDYDSKIAAGMTLLGLGTGVATSILSMRHSSMTWGRALAIDFATIWTGMNTEALIRALFFPAPEPGMLPGDPVVYSLFPRVLDSYSYLNVTLAAVDVLSLTARYLAIAYTRDRNFSPGRYSLLLSAFGWTSWYTSVLFSLAEGRERFSWNPNPFNLLTSILVADGAVILLDRFYDRLNWNSRRLLLSDILGAVTLGTGTLIGLLDSWTSSGDNNRALLSVWWSASGLLLGMNLFDPAESLGKTVLLLNSYAWTTTLSALLLSQAGSTHGWQFSLYAFAAPALGNVSVSLLNHYYPQLNWSSTRSWLISLSGVVGLVTGILSATFLDNPWIGEHYRGYLAVWSAAGLGLGTVFTRKMPPAVNTAARPAELPWYTALSLTPQFEEGLVSGMALHLNLEF